MTTLAEALAPRSDQLNSDDLISGPRVLKITAARISKEDRATKIVLNFEGDNGKPWKPCKTMGRAMVMAWAITDEKQLVGKSVRVYRDPEVKFGDQGAVGGIRISHMSDIAKPVSVKLTVSQGKKGMFTFHIGFVNGSADLERLASIQQQGRKAMDKLAGSNPELHARVTAAYAARFTELSNADDGDDPFAAGRDDAGMGEGFTDSNEQEG